MKFFHKLASVALAGTLAFSLSAGTALAASNEDEVKKLPWLENNGHDLSKRELPEDGDYWVFRGDSDGLTKSTIYVTNRQNGGDATYPAGVIKLDKDGKPLVTLANQPAGMQVLYAETEKICADGGEACFGQTFKKEVKIGGTISPQAQLGNNDFTITIERKTPVDNHENKVDGKMRIVVKSMADKYEPRLVGNSQNVPLSLKPGGSLTDASIKGFIQFQQYAKAGTLKEKKPFDGDTVSLPHGAALKYPKADASKYGVQQVPVTITYEDKTTDSISVFVKVSAKNPSQTPVNDPKSLTEDEKKAVEAAVKAANPTLPQDAKIMVATDGKVTITYADQSTDTVEAAMSVRAKTTAEKTDVKNPSQTPVNDPKSLTEDEKKAVEAAVKAANTSLPADAKIMVATDGKVTITYTDGSTDTVDASVSVRAKTTAEKTDVANPEVTPVVNPKSLTEDEKKAVEAAVKAANTSLPADAKIMVADDGKVTITYTDGSTDTVDASVSVRAKTTAEKTDVANPEVTPVVNPKSLTEDEKKAVEAAVKAANKSLPADAKIMVATDGKVTITYTDGSTDTVDASVSVRAKTTAEKTDVANPEVTPVVNPKSLTEDEKKAVEAAVKAANTSLPADAKIMVATDGKVTITYTDGSTDTVDASVSVRAKTTAEKTDVANPEVTPVVNPKSLTEDEKKAVEAAVKAANTSLPADAKIMVADDGKVTITYTDGSTDTVDASVSVRAKTTAEKTDVANPEVTPVVNPKSLTEDEKKAVEAAVKAANKSLPADAKIMVATDGKVTITYADQSTDTVDASVSVRAKTTAEKTKAAQPEVKMLSNTGTNIGAILMVAVSLVGIGLFAIVRRRNDA